MKNFIKAILITIGIFLIINTAFLSLVANFNAGLIISFAVGLVFLLYGIYIEKIRILTSKGLFKWLKFGVFIFAIFMFIVIVFIAVYGSFDTAMYDEDAIIVLGAGISGEAVTYPLMHRLNKAVEYVAKSPNAIIVVSGGQGPQEDITEALAMERHLIRKGVAKDTIIKEEKSTSTFENFKYSKRILDDYFDKPYKVSFVTNGFHIYRASRLANAAGLNATHFHAKIEWYTVAVSYLREFTAVLMLWILRR